MSHEREKTEPDLHQVREEIRHADEAMVRELTGVPDLSDDGWAARAVAARRIALGERVAACKFAREPDRFRALARARDAQGLERAITDLRTEAAVLERVRRQARERGCAEELAERMAGFYRERIIPETKRIQVRLLSEWGRRGSTPHSRLGSAQ